ncbi:MAG: hypothetical protein K2X81_27780, partial [Candidatus Obscuribacterales bacterium]|nr:hypothetical protein [Candidatus Obscuribacterales bacterium]
GSFSKIVNGVGTTVGSYRYTDNARKRFQVTGRAGITYGIGNAIGAGEVVRDQVTREWLHYKQKRQNSLLSQQLEEEWKQLDSAKIRLQN